MESQTLDPPLHREKQGGREVKHPSADILLVTKPYLDALDYANRNVSTIQALPYNVIHEIILRNLKKNPMIKGYQHNGTNDDVVYLLERDMAKSRWTVWHYRIFLLAMSRFDFDLVVEIACVASYPYAHDSNLYSFGYLEDSLRYLRSMRDQNPGPIVASPMSRDMPLALAMGSKPKGHVQPDGEELEVPDFVWRVVRVQINAGSTPETKYYRLWATISLLYAVCVTEDLEYRKFWTQASVPTTIMREVLRIWETMTVQDIDYLIREENRLPRKNDLHLFEDKCRRIIMGYNRWPKWNYIIMKELAIIFSGWNEVKTFDDHWFYRDAQDWLMDVSDRGNHVQGLRLAFDQLPSEFNREMYTPTMRFVIEILMPFRLHAESGIETRLNALTFLADAALLIIRRRRKYGNLLFGSREAETLIIDAMADIFRLESWNYWKQTMYLMEEAPLRRKMKRLKGFWRSGAMPGLTSVMKFWDNALADVSYDENNYDSDEPATDETRKVNSRKNGVWEDSLGEGEERLSEDTSQEPGSSSNAASTGVPDSK